MPKPKSPPKSAANSPVVDATVGDVAKVLKSYSSEFYVRIILIVATIAVYIVCMVLFFNNNEEQEFDIAQFFGYKSGFLFNGWYMGVLLTVGFAGLVFILTQIDKFNMLFILFYVIYIVFFAIGFALVYNKKYTKSSPTAQILSIISALGGFAMIPLLFYISKMPVVSLLLAIPSLFILGGCIYLGGVINTEYQLA